MARITLNRVAGCGAALAVLGAGAAVALVLVGGLRAARAMERLERSGEPRTLAELEPLRASGPSPDAWLARLGAPVRGAMLSPENLQRVLARLEEAGPPDPDVEAFAACLAADGRDVDAFANDLRHDLRRGRAPSGCQVAALRAAASVDPDELAVLRTACAVGGVDWRAALDALERSDEPFPEWEGGPVLAAVRRLGTLAVLAAVEGRPEEAVALLGEAACAARVLRHGPWSVAAFGSLLAEEIVAVHLQHSLPYLGPDADVRDLTALVTERTPLADGVRALQGERVLGLRVFDGFAAEVASDLGVVGRALLGVMLELDRAAFLETYERGLDHARGRYWEERDGLRRLSDELGEPGRWRPLSALLLSRFEVHVEQHVAAEARRRLCLLALESLPHGADAARAAAEATLDPFSGAPLRTRVEDDGTLVVWSVGPNLADDGGRDGHDRERQDAWGETEDWDDLVLYVRAR